MMRCLPILALAIAAASLLPAQVDQKTFRFRSPVTDQDFQDLTVATLSTTGLKVLATDAALREISASGSADQIRAAEWIVAELDRPIASTPPPPSNLYTIQTTEPENTIRVFYPAQTPSVQALNEVATTVRTIGDLRYVVAYGSHRAIVLRGTREQIDMSEWLLDELNKTAPQQTYVFPRTGAPENQVRVFRFARAADVQQFNEVQTLIRTLTQTRRVYPYIAKRAMVLRGTDEQLDMTAWILAQLEKDLPLAQKMSTSEYGTKAGDVMRLFYFSGSMTPQAFNDAATSIRLSTGIRIAYPFATARTLAVRGTAAQIAHVAALAAQ